MSSLGPDLSLHVSRRSGSKRSGSGHPPMGRRKAGVGQKLTFAFGLSSSFSGSNPEETIDTPGQLVESELIASSREIFAIPFARSSATSTATP